MENTGKAVALRHATCFELAWSALESELE